MQIHEALSTALSRHQLPARQVAISAGLSESQVSLFLSGSRGMVYKNISLFIEALPDHVYREFCTLLAGGQQSVAVDQAIAALKSANLSDDQIATLLNVASQKLRSPATKLRSQVQDQIPVSA